LVLVISGTPAGPAALCLLPTSAAVLQLAVAATWPVVGAATVDIWMRAIF
jgi:hypothetical protein